LQRDTMVLLGRGSCTGRQLSSLVGRWTWALLVRRPCLAVLGAVFRFQQCAGNRRFAIWRSVRQELLSLVALAPLLFARLGAPFVPRLVATDASEFGQGVVASRLGAVSVAASLTAMHDVRPLLPPDPVVSVDAPAPPHTDPRDLPSLPPPLDTAPWRTIVSSAWRREEHINCLELRALNTAVRWTLSFPDSIRSRLVVLTDSMVVLGAVTKGRSSSPDLLRRLRSLSSLLLASGLTLSLCWVPTHLNPADEPSRACRY
jgi:hypothetical protein